MWTILGLAFVSVLAFTEYPTFSQANPHRTKLYNDRYLLIPHAVLALTAANQRVLLHRGRARIREALADYFMGAS